MNRTLPLLQPDWPAPSSIRALMTTRQGGVSGGAYESFNLGLHCGDVVEDAQANRQHLRDVAQLPNEPVWLRQTHSTNAVLAEHYDPQMAADASFTRSPGVVCAVMTADCLPILITNTAGTEVAAIHAGWAGMADGVIEQTLAQLSSAPEDLQLWFGAAIGPQAFEVGEEVIERFLQHDPKAEQGFVPRSGVPGKWLGNLYQLARHRCAMMGVSEQQISGGGECTHNDAERFFSYRRDRETGRMASLIWIADET